MQAKQGRMKPTHIMYKANLSHDQLTSYLEELLGKELIEKVASDADRQYFLVTNKGEKFAEKLREMRQFEKSFGF